MRVAGMVCVLASVLLMAGTVWAAAIPNGSFEDTSEGTGWVLEIADWTMDPQFSRASHMRAGLFTSFDGFVAQDGEYFAIITHRTSVSQTILSLEFDIDSPLLDTITFDYLYATSWPEDALQDDPFTVTITNVDTGASMAYTVASANTPGMNSGSLTTIPFDRASTFYDTGWQTYSIDVGALYSSTVYLEFQVEDSGQGGLSAFFLDDVRLTPEPGTLALCGAGFLGLALYGRRRRRRKKR